MKRYLVATLIAIAMAGCATEPVPTATTTLVPSERVLSTVDAHAGPGTGLVMIKRDAGYLGSRCELRVLANARPLALLMPSERIEVYLPAGDYVLSVDTNGRCEKSLAEVATTVKSEGQTAFRVGYAESGDVRISPTVF